MDKTKPTKKRKSGAKQSQVMDGLGMSFEESIKMFSQPVKQEDKKIEQK